MKHGFLSQQQVNDYRANGHLFPMSAMPPEKASEYLAKLDIFEKAYPERASEILRSKSHLVLTWANELIRLEPVLDAVESLIGPDIYCWSTSFFIKDPRHPGFIAWHQDAPFSGMPDGELVTAWIALTPSIEENGCLKVVSGSHTKVVEHAHLDRADNLLSAGQEISVDVDEKDATKIVLAPGQFSFHHQMIIHGSDPNVSDLRRVGLAVRYVKPLPREGEAVDSATLVRGTDRYGSYKQDPVPASDMDPAAVAYLDDLLIRKFGTRYRKKAVAEPTR